MSNILAGDACKILKISKRTLYRWEKEGRVRSARDGMLNVRVYDPAYIEMVKKIIDLDKQEKEHLAKLPGILEEEKKHHLEQDYHPGKPLKLSTEEEVEAAMRAFDAEEAWMAEHKRLLNELFIYPRDIIREVLEIT